MPVIDLHAHVTPERYKKAIREEGTWYGLDATAGELDRGGFAQPLSMRLAEMDRFGVDMQLVTPTVGFYQYDNDLDVTKAIAVECNDEISEMITDHPRRFAGLGTVPMQDIPSAIAEMERVVHDLGFKGVIIKDHVEGKTYDHPDFEPFFSAAQELGALLFFHQGGESIVTRRVSRYKVPNAIGNLTERTLLYATLVFGGVLDRFADLKLLLAHAGGYTAYGIARMDKVAGALPGDFDGKMNPPFGPNDGFANEKPPSDYLQRFYYDCCTYSGPALRFLIDTVGIDQVVLGTDYPAPMFLHDPVNWVRGLDELTDSEKDAVLTDNSNRLLEI
ncbi:MAG TPA: amidohydrolase family protein [Acidimicrobiia bacterium]|nr:amidohydrolase family protein [Acidimicrobiia bacterium]